jgi:integrase
MTININKDIVYKQAQPKEKEYLISDGGGLYLLVKPNGGKLWRFVYQFEQKQKKLSLGRYPDILLAQARAKSVQARENVANGIDPSVIKQAQTQQSLAEKENKIRLNSGLPIIGSFKDVAQQWLDSTKHLNSPATHHRKSSRISRFTFELIGNKPIGDIKSNEILATIKPLIDQMKLETAHRLHSEINAIFNYAIAHALADYNPAQPIAKQIPPQKVKHRAAIIDPTGVGQLLRDIHNYQGTFVVQTAIKLSPLVFQRPSEISRMMWSDIDFAAKEWRPYISKTDFHHIVPLSRQAIELLEKIKPLTNNQKYVFPSTRNNGRPMSDNTIRTALLSLGYNSDTQTAHGFRTIASTLLNEQGWSADAIERQLAHAPRDKVRAAYNRAQYLEERREMMQKWADYLEQLKSGTQIVPFKK